MSGSTGTNEVDKKERSMSNLALSLFQQVNGGNLGPYNPSASEWWAWAGAACFLVGIVGFSIMGLRAKEKGRGHFAHKILIVLVAMISYIALAFTQGVERAGEDTYFGYARFMTGQSPPRCSFSGWRCSPFRGRATRCPWCSRSWPSTYT